MKRVLVRGWWSTNLGDDLFLKILCERYPKIRFETAVKKEHQDVFQSIPNLEMKFLPNNKTIEKIFTLLHAKLLSRKVYFANIEIGGSIFMFAKEQIASKNLGFRVRETLRKKINYSFVLGSNFGPYVTREQVQTYDKYFSKLTDVCFRDQFSKDVFEKNDKVRKAPDIVLSMKNIEKYIRNEEYIVFSVIDINEKGDVAEKTTTIEYEKKIIELTNFFTKQGKRVIFMSFCDLQGDRKAAERLKEKINQKEMVDIYSHTSIEESLKILGGSEKILATRFHAMILGWAFSKEVLVFSYSKKTNQVIEYLNPDQTILDLHQLSDKNSEELASSFHKISPEVRERIMEQAEEQFLILDKVL